MLLLSSRDLEAAAAAASFLELRVLLPREVVRRLLRGVRKAGNGRRVCHGFQSWQEWWFLWALSWRSLLGPRGSRNMTTRSRKATRSHWFPDALVKAIGKSWCTATRTSVTLISSTLLSVSSSDAAATVTVDGHLPKPTKSLPNCTSSCIINQLHHGLIHRVRWELWISFRVKFSLWGFSIKLSKGLTGSILNCQHWVWNPY